MFATPDGRGSAIAIVGYALTQSIRRNLPIRAHRNDEIHHCFIPRMVVARPPKARCIGIAHRENTVCTHIHANVIWSAGKLGRAAIKDLGLKTLARCGNHGNGQQAVLMHKAANIAIQLHLRDR